MTRRVPLDIRGLDGRVELFRLSGATARDPAVERWFTQDASPLRALAREWFAQMRACGPDVRELVHDGCPVACVGDAAFGYVNAFKAHVNVGFYLGALLEDPQGLLDGNGKRMRHVKLLPGREVDGEALARLIEAAYLDTKARS